MKEINKKLLGKNQKESKKGLVLFVYCFICNNSLTLSFVIITDSFPSGDTRINDIEQEQENFTNPDAFTYETYAVIEGENIYSYLCNQSAQKKSLILL